MRQAEVDLLDQIKKAETEHQHAKSKLAKAKRDLTNAETDLINTKLHVARLREQLRVYRNTTPRNDLSARDLEIQKFREEYPELCEWARQRDLLAAGGDDDPTNQS